MKRKFRKFLSDNNCITEWYRNVQNDKHHTNLNYLFNKHPPTDFICCPFAWYATPEGVEFWINLEKKWKEEIKKQ